MNTVRIRIGQHEIGEGCPVYVIAEGCDNHMGDLECAKEMARQARLARCHAIKYQHHLPDEEMLPNVPMSSNFDEPLYEFLKKHALTLDQHLELKRYCEDIGIQYLCTPFSYKAAEEIASIGVEAIKIGSGEMTDIPSLVKMAENLRLPMIVSTGMCTLDEINETYEALCETGVALSFTNCCSEYPPVYEDINLGVIGLMKQRFPRAVIGHSDHTPDLFTCYAAVAAGARIIEKHVILDKRTPGPDQSVSIDFMELAQLVDGVAKVDAAMGCTKQVNDREQQIREWAFRSIVTTMPIRKGDVIGGEMIWSKRPGTGIPSKCRPQVIGRTAARDLPANVLLAWSDLEGEA